MKSLREYLDESEHDLSNPVAGDNFAIELDDGTLIETWIMESNSDCLLLDATPEIIAVLEQWAGLDDVLLEHGGGIGPRQHWQELDEFFPALAAGIAGADIAAGMGASLLGRAAAGVAAHGAYNAITGDEEVEEAQIQDAGEYDYEGDMAKDDLQTIIRAARKLTGMLDDNENMPEWVQSKINKAADYVDTAADYIESNQDEQVIAESTMSDLRRAVYQIILDIHFGAKYGDEMIDTVTDELGDYFDDVEASDDAVLKKVYAYVRSEGAEAEGDPARMDRVALNAIEYLNYDGARGNLNEFAPGMAEAKYQGREVALGKPMAGDVKKFKVYVRDPATGNIKKVNFGHGGKSARRAGQKTMRIRKSNPAARRSFRARHNCDNPGPRTKARYWSCRKW